MADYTPITDAELAQMKDRNKGLRTDAPRLLREVEELRAENAIWKERTKFASDENEELRAALRALILAADEYRPIPGTLGAELGLWKAVEKARAALGEKP